MAFYTHIISNKLFYRIWQKTTWRKSFYGCTCVRLL